MNIKFCSIMFFYQSPLTIINSSFAALRSPFIGIFVNNHNLTPASS